MQSKQDILDYVAEYTPVELAGFIRDGIVSYDELCEESDFSARARREVRELIANSEEKDWQNAVAANTVEEYDNYLNNYPEGQYRSQAREAKKKLLDLSSDNEAEEKWNGLDKDDAAALKSFIESYPDSPYSIQAKELLSKISRKRYTDSAIKRLKKDINGEADPDVIVETIKEYVKNGSITLDQLYAEIKKNHNIINSTVIDRLEKSKIFNFSDLEINANINRKFFDFITNENLNDPVINVESKPIDSIASKTTEVYFWGIPSSGKTCALGAIMSEAKHGDYIDFAEPDRKCQGYDYMTQLYQMFEDKKDVFMLPPGTQTDDIFEMGYVFKKQNKDYPVTFIDLAGETINSMYRTDAQLGLTPKQQTGLDIACRLLTGNAKVNRKIHFFVLEYKGHKKKYKGLTQDTLLTGAMTFIKDTGIFRTETDAVYLLVTKSDLTGATSEEERNAILADYIKTHYRQFYNGLRDLCKKNEINEGNVDIVPFSLGDVCFQNLCLYDNATARTVVELIINRAKGFGTGKIANLLKKFKG